MTIIAFSDCCHPLCQWISPQPLLPATKEWPGQKVGKREEGWNTELRAVVSCRIGFSNARQEGGEQHPPESTKQPSRILQQRR